MERADKGLVVPFHIQTDGGMLAIQSSQMPRRDRLRRVVKLCSAFARNLAYFRVGRSAEFASLFDPNNPSANFWCVANSNSLDICVLECCKLLGDENDKHHWKNIVADGSKFLGELMARVGMAEADYLDYLRGIRHYRDKFLAHLDSEYTMHIPQLDMAKAAVWFYHAHIVLQEAKPGDLMGLAIDLEAGYRHSEEEARAVLQAAKA